MARPTGWHIRSRKHLGKWMLVNSDLNDTPEQRLSPMTFYSRERAEAVMEALQKTGLVEQIEFEKTGKRW